MKIKIGAVSMPAIADKQKNIEKHLFFIEDAAKQGINLLVFPEGSISGWTKEFTVGAIDPDTSYYEISASEYIPEGSSTKLMIEQAKKYNMYICFGLFEKDKLHCEKVYNTAVLVGPDGFIGKYHKVHLVGTEQLYFFTGNSFQVFDTPIGKIGLMICYDQAFPEAARCLKLLGAEIVLCPTAWPVTDNTRSESDPNLSMFRTLGNSRAFENGFVFVDCNMFTDLDCKWPCCGHSRIVSPSGTELATVGYEEAMAVAEVDVQEEIKKTYCIGMGLGSNSFMRDLRPDIYMPIYETLRK